MTALLWIVAVAAVIAAVVFVAVRWRREADVRVVRCPETGTKHAVQIDAAHALTHSERRLKSCSRWPERQDCDQPCLAEIAAAPDGCKVRTQLDLFYAGATCALCGKGFGNHIDWSVHEPGLLDANGHVSVWEEYPAQQLDTVLAERQPVCWDCTQLARVAERHPERITVRKHRYEAEN